jgi:phosphomannomutase
MISENGSDAFKLDYKLGSKDYLFLNLMIGFERTLRLYDLRGDSKYFGPHYMRRLGRALGSRLETGQYLAVSGDNRESTEPLKKALIRAVLETGVNVLDLGMTPTPVTYLANFLIEDPLVSGSVMITASHCEKHENGMKITINQRPFCGDRLKALAMDALNDNWRIADTPGTRQLLNINPQYNSIVDRMVDRIRGTMDRKVLATVVVDGGHGLIGPRASKIYERDLGLYTHKLYCSPDRSFSAHSPDPSRKLNMINLASTVSSYQESAIIGLAFDGDGDRLSVVDGNGRMYFGPELTTLFLVQQVRSEGPARFAADTQLPLSVIRWIAKHLEDGLCIIREPGNPQFKQTILDEQLDFGGETSGHFLFTPLDHDERFRHVAVDDALLASLELVQSVYHSGMDFRRLAEGVLAEVHDGTTTVWSKRFALPEEHRMALLREVGSRFRTSVPDLGPRLQFRCTESIKHFSPSMDEVLTIRPSQTEPVLKVQWEGPRDSLTKATIALKRELAECYRKARTPLPEELS